MNSFRAAGEGGNPISAAVNEAVGIDGDCATAFSACGVVEGVVVDTAAGVGAVGGDLSPCKSDPPAMVFNPWADSDELAATFACC